MISFQSERYHLLMAVVMAGLLLSSITSPCRSETEKNDLLSEEEIIKELSHWLESPLKYIMTSQEGKLLKKLKTLEEKMQFVRIFWARRDYNPETGTNEFR